MSKILHSETPQASETNRGHWKLAWRPRNGTSLCTNTGAFPALTVNLDQHARLPQNSNSGGRFLHAAPSGCGLLMVMFLGIGSDGGTMDCRVHRWECEDDLDISPAEDLVVWRRHLACEVRATLGTLLGVGGMTIAPNWRWADTIAFSGAGDRLGNSMCRILAPGVADQGKVMLAVDLLGAPYFELELRGESNVSSPQAMFKGVNAG